MKTRETSQSTEKRQKVKNNKNQRAPKKPVWRGSLGEQA